MSIKATLTRNPSCKVQTLGVLELYSGEQKIYECKTLELPWKDNEKQISCIPIGNYKVVPRSSEKYKKHFHITNVPNRTWILIHFGNYFTQIRGCILTGTGFSDINKDGHLDVVNSKVALDALLEKAPNGFELTITQI
jgi:hypothetical protein